MPWMWRIILTVVEHEGLKKKDQPQFLNIKEDSHSNKSENKELRL